MKTLIQESIKIRGINKRYTTALELEQNADVSNIEYYKELSSLAGRSVTVTFEYDENEITTKDKLKTSIGGNSTTDEIRTSVINMLENYLNN